MSMLGPVKSRSERAMTRGAATNERACGDAALLAELRERLVDPRGSCVVAERDEEVRRLDVAAQVELAVDGRVALAGGAREALREEIHSTDARGVVDDRAERDVEIA